MDVVKTSSSLTLAAAAAAMFALAPVSASAGENDVQCMGVNACKGQGFVMVSAEACEQLGGTAG